MNVQEALAVAVDALTDVMDPTVEGSVVADVIDNFRAYAQAYGLWVLDEARGAVAYDMGRMIGRPGVQIEEKETRTHALRERIERGE